MKINIPLLDPIEQLLLISNHPVSVPAGAGRDNISGVAAQIFDPGQLAGDSH